MSAIGTIKSFLFSICIFISNIGFAYDVYFSEVGNFDIWEVPDLNPAELKVGRFYYAIVVENQLFISVIREAKDAEIGRRAGGHFKLLKGYYMAKALRNGSSVAEAREVGLDIQRTQASYKTRYHEATGFGFKPMLTSDGRLVFKWHGFNSYKSTINITRFENHPGPAAGQVMWHLTHKYGGGHELVHPLTDQDLRLNPKYLDTESKYYRGEEFLWARTEEMAEQVRWANEILGLPKSQKTEQIVALNPARLHPNLPKQQCLGLMGRLNHAFGWIVGEPN